MRKPKACLPDPLECDVQQAIVDAFHLAGATVFQTNTHLQRGPSGIQKGVPDLLVAWDFLPFTFFPIDVKRPGKWRYSSPEQKRAVEERRYGIATSPWQALVAASAWMVTYWNPDLHRGHAVERKAQDAFDRLNNVIRSLEAA